VGYFYTSTCATSSSDSTSTSTKDIIINTIESELQARATIPAQHYDARFDSVLMFKAWLRDEFGDEFTRASKNAHFSVSLYPIQRQYSAETCSGASSSSSSSSTACVARLVRMPW